MKAELIHELFIRFEAAKGALEDLEFWSARQLQDILGYTEWRNFLNAIDKAKLACHNSKQTVSDHFVNTINTINVGNGGAREVDDIALSRYACYLIAQNGDPGKEQIAFAQTYFAVQTRKQEVIERRLDDIERVTAREKLSKSEKKLSAVIYERGVDDRGFAVIRTQGDRALFGGHSTQAMKTRLQVPAKRPLADFLPTLTIKAKDFATELTSHNVIDKNLTGQHQISGEHVANNRAVRKILQQRGVKPELLPPAEDVKKVRRQLQTEHKKLAKV